MHEIKKLIETLQLQPHPEGGYYRETYRCPQLITVDGQRHRHVSTSIYYLLIDDDVSRFHRIMSDELWYFHCGQALEIFSFENGRLKTDLLGNDIEHGEMPQLIIPAHNWFAARIQSAKGYALVSCSVAPGFDFADFALAKRSALMQDYPQHQKIIEELTRKD